MVVLALTGEPGAGKSTAARWFAAHGACLIDADKIVGDLGNGDDLPRKAVERWGKSVLLPNGQISRKAVADKIFTDDQEYRWLCDTIHPLVQREMEKRLPQKGFVVAEIPMLFESGRPDWVDKVLFLTAGAASRAERNGFRGLDAAEIARREKFFLPRNERIALSDWVVSNDGDEEELKAQLEALWLELLRMEELSSVPISQNLKKGDSIE